MAVYFADTSFWIALSSRRDQHHSRAVGWSRYLLRTKATILTTEVILWEWLNALADPAARGTAAAGYRRCHRDPQIEVVPPHMDLLQAAVQLYEARNDKHWSLTDCLSFVLMERHQLLLALTTDQHFHQTGFRVLLLEDPPAS